MSAKNREANSVEIAAADKVPNSAEGVIFQPDRKVGLAALPFFLNSIGGRAGKKAKTDMNFKDMDSSASASELIEAYE